MWKTKRVNKANRRTSSQIEKEREKAKESSAENER